MSRAQRIVRGKARWCRQQRRWLDRGPGGYYRRASISAAAREGWMEKIFLRARGLLLAMVLAASVALVSGCRHDGDAATSPAAGATQNAASDPNAPDPRITGEAEIRALDAEMQKA